MNYIIFGGSGFIGTHLIHLLKAECVKEGDEIYDLDIGANSTLLPKVSVGEKSTVGAGAVVTKNVDSNIVVAGVPARILRK